MNKITKTMSERSTITVVRNHLLSYYNGQRMVFEAIISDSQEISVVRDNKDNTTIYTVAITGTPNSTERLGRKEALPPDFGIGIIETSFDGKRCTTVIYEDGSSSNSTT